MCLDQLERADPVPVPDSLVHWTGPMLADPERQPDLERKVGPERLHRAKRHALRLTLAGDDVGLPGMGVDTGLAQPLELGEAAEVRAVTVRALLVEAVDAGSRLDRHAHAALTLCHGAKAFRSPRSAGASSGK